MTIFHGQAELLRQFRDGEPDALEAVYRCYVHKVAGLVRHGVRTSGGATLRRPEDLGDLVQEIFLRAFAPAARAGYDGEREYGPYLYAVARNLMVDWARRELREVPTEWLRMEALLEEAKPSGEGPELIEPALRALVDHYLSDLGPDLRSVHRLRYEQGLTQAEAAVQLGVSRQNLRTLEQRLRKGLRRAIQLQQGHSRRA